MSEETKVGWPEASAYIAFFVCAAICFCAMASCTAREDEARYKAQKEAADVR